MLVDTAPQYISLVGIDPGSTHLGVSVMRVDPINWKIIDTRAKTFHAQQLIKGDMDLVVYNGERLARIKKINETLYSLFYHERPLWVACESPFYSQRRPSAFGALTEVIASIRDAVFQYDNTQSLLLIDPPTVKKAVGAKGNADKDSVKDFVLNNKDINYTGVKSINLLDEHAIDSIAVNYAQFIIKGQELCLAN